MMGSSVSILTGSEEPVQPAQAGRVHCGGRFQSSPAPKSRCNEEQTGGLPEMERFQSSPAPKSRCNSGWTRQVSACRSVSILTGSEEPVQRCHRSARGGGGGVSILTGSEEPVQPANLLHLYDSTSFNPHRLRRAGATTARERVCQRVLVSILTGSEEPVQLLWRRNRRADCLFQSSPAPKSRCNRLSRAAARPAVCFNPHRLRRAGATAANCGPSVLQHWFQSSPAPKSRCNLSSQGCRADARSFNPHRLRRAGATGSRAGCRGGRKMFQSSPAPKSRCNAAAW